MYLFTTLSIFVYAHSAFKINNCMCLIIIWSSFLLHIFTKLSVNMRRIAVFYFPVSNVFSFRFHPLRFFTAYFYTACNFFLKRKLPWAGVFQYAMQIWNKKLPRWILYHILHKFAVGTFRNKRKQDKMLFIGYVLVRISQRWIHMHTILCLGQF